MGSDWYTPGGGLGVPGPEPHPFRRYNTRHLLGPAVMEAAGGLRPRPAPRKPTQLSASVSRRLLGREWRPATPCFLQEASISLLRFVSGYRWGPKIAFLHPFTNRGFPAWRCRRRSKGTPRHSARTGIIPALWAPDSALQGTSPFSSLPPGHAPAPRVRPDPGLSQSQAASRRPLPPRMRREACPPPAYCLP